eukprot:1397868-Rhodomonas_salina.1
MPPWHARDPNTVDRARGTDRAEAVTVGVLAFAAQYPGIALHCTMQNRAEQTTVFSARRYV